MKTRHLFPLALGAIGWCGASPAMAEDVPPPPTNNHVPAPAQTPQPVPTGTIAQGVPPWQKRTFPLPMNLRLHGGMEIDVGYAKYTYDTITFTPEDFYDFRGRFVLGPQLRYDFGKDYFFGGVAQFVVWIREQFNLYQGNVDDVYAQVGQNDVWDVMVGRFMTWRVFRKGLGFDLYTLEDTGALRRPTLEGAAFGPHVYEVDNIFYRGTPGRLAFHLYPSSWSGIETVGEYGKDGTSNSLGGRAAGNVTVGPVSVSAAGEYRTLRPAVDNSPVGPDGVTKIECPKCGVTNRSGYGGGIVFNLSPIEAGFNAAQSRQQVYSQTNGEPDKNGNVKTTSLGGYLELDVGTLAMNRRLVLGGGLNRTESLAETDEFQRHVQLAGYIAYPLGFNEAIIKIVLTQANLRWEEVSSVMSDTVILHNSKMLAGRVRLTFLF